MAAAGGGALAGLLLRRAAGAGAVWVSAFAEFARHPAGARTLRVAPRTQPNEKIADFHGAR